MTTHSGGATSDKPVQTERNTRPEGGDASPPAGESSGIEAADESCAVDFDAAHDRAS
jgi:hypothetical protein